PGRSTAHTTCSVSSSDFQFGRAASTKRAPRPLRRGPLSDRTDLYGTDARQGAAGREGDGVVEILDVDEHIPAQMLARLRERTIGQEPFAVAHPDAGCRGRRVQRVAAQVLRSEERRVGKGCGAGGS